MSREYAEDKIRGALKSNKGNVALARQQIIGESFTDFELLRALVRPHLDGIVAYQVERVASGRAELEKRHPEEPTPQISDHFGMDLLRAVAATEAEIFGHEELGATKRRVASKQHIDAIHKMASGSRIENKPVVKRNPYKNS